MAKDMEKQTFSDLSTGKKLLTVAIAVVVGVVIFSVTARFSEAFFTKLFGG